MKNIQITDLSKTIKKFVDSDYNRKDGRYKSWEFCYKYFHKIFKKNKINEKERDYASLMLAFYLTSWGMYRGSSFLFKDYTYTIHKKAIDILFKYKKIFTHDVITNSEKESLFELIEKLENYYKKLKLETSNKHNVEVSKTLISKIIMGVSGIIPAYDRNVKKELKRRRLSQTLSRVGYEDLWKLYQENQQEINKLSKLYKKYPPMKILDMYLWKKGSDIKD